MVGSAALIKAAFGLAWLDRAILGGLNWAHIVWARLGSGGLISAEINSAWLVLYQQSMAVLRSA